MVTTLIHQTTKLAATVEAPAEARAALVEAIDTPIAEDALETARLLVTELVTNSVRHAIAPPGSTIRVEIHSDDRRLRVEVYDSGRLAPDFGAGKRSDGGGFGLRLVEQLSDRWGSEHDERGACVWFEILLRPA